MSRVLRINSRKALFLRDLNSAVVLLSPGKGLWARCLRWASASQYAYAGMVLDGLVYDLDGGQFRCRPLRTFTDPYDLFAVQGMTEDKVDLCRRWWRSQRDREGSGRLMTMLRCGLSLVAHLFGTRPLSEDAAAFKSSQAVWDCLRRVEIYIKNETKVLTPGDLAWSYELQGPLGPRIG